MRLPAKNDLKMKYVSSLMTSTNWKEKYNTHQTKILKGVTKVIKEQAQEIHKEFSRVAQ
jgi:hypothetical protein